MKKFLVLLLIFTLLPLGTVSAKTAMEKEVDLILSKIEPGMTDLEKLITVYQYFTMNYQYDESLKNHSADSLFTSGKAVCEGFAYGMKYILDLLGFENDYAYIPGHMWNMVKLDGEWYHMDVTWDNPVSTMQDLPFASSHFFLTSDELLADEEFYYKNGITDIQGHNYWSAEHKATSTKYDDAVWRKSGFIEPINVVNGNWYMGHSVLGIVKYNPNTGKYKSILPVENYSDKYDAQVYGFVGGAVHKYGKYLYFTTSRAIFKLNLDSGRLDLVKSYVATEYYLNGMKINNNILTYYKKAGGISKPTETGTITLEELDTKFNVTFNVHPENALVSFGTSTKRATEGKVVFDGVASGSYNYSVSASGYETVKGKAAVSNLNSNVYNINLKKYVDVTFKCNINGASVQLGDETKKINSGTAVFEKVLEGSYPYTVSASGRVTQNGELHVTDGMPDVEISLLKPLFLKDITGLRTLSAEFDESTRKITVWADYTQVSAGFAVTGETTSLKAYTVESDKNISRAEKDGKIYFVAKKSVGFKQNFKIHITSDEGIVYTYDVDFNFRRNPDDLKILDVLGLRVANAEITDTKIQFNIDNALTSAGFQLVLPEGVKAEYEWVSSTEGLTKESVGNTTAYNSLVTGEVGGYGKVSMKVFPKTNGIRQKLNAKLYYEDHPDQVKNYVISLAFKDVSYEGDVCASELLPLRVSQYDFYSTSSLKKIILYADEGVTSAGFSLKVNGKPPTKFTCQSGKKLAYGQKGDYRYIVARRSAGNYQTYYVKLFDGYEYSVYNVEIYFM